MTGVGDRPLGRVVRTVRGDIAPTTLGVTLAHEHLIARPPAFVTDPDLTLDSEAAATRELNDFAALGGTCVVEMTTVDYGRNVAELRAVSAASGVHIIATTGFNQGKFSDSIVDRHTDDELVEFMTREVLTGTLAYQPPEAIDLTQPAGEPGRLRAGVIKGSSGPGGPSEGELRGLRAAAEAHVRTGAPVSTHTTRADWAHEQAEMLLRAGVEPDKLLIGHLDFRPDVAWLKELAATGARLGFDQFSKSKYLSDRKRVEVLAALASAGHLRQLLLSGDLARRSYWPAYGTAEAPGLTHIPRTVVPLLRAAGFGAAEIQVLLVENPRDWLAFTPPT